MRRCGLVVCVIASVAPGLAQPWQTCYAVEGISYECGPGDSPKPFAQFVGGGVWKDVGSWGAHRIRIVHGASSSFVLVEGSRGIFAPLMQWRGSMPEVELHDVDGVKVLAMSRDFGGNVPMVSTWAWLWSDKGPVRLDVEGALAKAIDTVAPGHVGYQTGINWKTLRTGTGVWKGGYPGKIGVGLTVDVWFELNEDDGIAGCTTPAFTVRVAAGSRSARRLRAARGTSAGEVSGGRVSKALAECTGIGCA